MRMRLIFVALLLLVVSLGVSLARKPQEKISPCGFTVRTKPVEPSITGPDEIVPLVHVVEQPDSPIEVVSVDLTGTWLSISQERTTDHLCAKYRVRNRSDRTVQEFEIMLMLSTIRGEGGGSVAVSSSSLLPEQAADVVSCGVNGGSGGAKDNHVLLLVYVKKLDFEDCHYKPSLRIPRSLNVHTVW